MKSFLLIVTLQFAIVTILCPIHHVLSSDPSSNSTASAAPSASSLTSSSSSSSNASPEEKETLIAEESQPSIRRIDREEDIKEIDGLRVEKGVEQSSNGGPSRRSDDVDERSISRRQDSVPTALLSIDYSAAESMPGSGGASSPADAQAAVFSHESANRDLQVASSNSPKGPALSVALSPNTYSMATSLALSEALRAINDYQQGNNGSSSSNEYYGKA